MNLTDNNNVLFHVSYFSLRTTLSLCLPRKNKHQRLMMWKNKMSKIRRKRRMEPKKKLVFRNFVNE